VCCGSASLFYHPDADPDSVFLFDADADPDSTFHPDADPDPSFQINAQILEKVLKEAYIPYILACHLQLDSDPVPDPAYHFDADPDFYLMRMRIRMRIQVTKVMRIRIHKTVSKSYYLDH
jgi:hypothetical protein